MKPLPQLLSFLLLACLGWNASAFELGQERLSEPEFLNQLTGKRVGILAHHASRDHAGKHVVDRLRELSGIELKMIFAPEHGFRSVDDDRVADSIDPVTGLPVYSLYGPRRAPTPEMLSQLDLVLIDLQDIGLRYYTYPATVTYVLQACKKAGIKVMILDRPNPLGGEVVEGATLDSKLVDGGLTTLAAIPTRHGLTLGELALYLNSKLQIGADLTVIPMKDYTRHSDWASTGLPWTPPSPALVSSDQAIYYSVFGAFEAGNFAVGRGLSNELAFKVIGAPWISDSARTKLVACLQSVVGLQSEAYDWTVTRAIYADQKARGVKFAVANDISIRAFPILLQVMKAVRLTLGESASNLRNMLSMLGAPWVLDATSETSALSEAIAHSEADSAEFTYRSESFRIY